MNIRDKKVADLFNKIKKFKEEGNALDLSSKEDLGIAVMNLISMEEHFFFTYEKTKDEKYLDLLNKIREFRKELLAKIVKNPDGEIWCISKHLLSASMRLMEVGTKKLRNGGEKETKDLFDKAYALWNIFWGLNLNLIDVKDVKQRDENENNNLEVAKGKKSNVFDKLSGIIKSIIDCCKE
ncbi:MAG: hypothetical protein KAS91_00180 [Candidatus Pacebacteria bacterium]|nr:hypothetical protein [Candidatus Paceibacterota bacterium]